MFDVKIDDAEKVSTFKKAIKDKNPKELKDVDANKLQLFLAKKKDDDRRKQDDVIVDNSRNVGRFQDDWRACSKLQASSRSGEKFAKECTSLGEWRVGDVHMIPYIFRFMRTLGGCTVDGKIFWRLEEKQVVEVLMDGWFRESTADNINVHANKKSILIGSPGIGKSTVLCVLAFCLVLKYQKNVLVYRRLKMLDQESCLFYLGYEDGRVVQFTVQRCESKTAVDIYNELIRQHGIAIVWLLLDGFHYPDIPEGLETFKLLATSQPVDLKSQERVYAYCCLLSSWSKKDLWSLGNLIHKFGADEMDERYYYSGGSVREFTLDTSEEIRKTIDDAVSGMEELSIVSRMVIGDAGPVT
ncbi:hypothetical protein PF002_g25102 [Phytophthora fragariae]|uniref:Crinkler effector protein N-terminal domain-containing protein n=1 Tax=Phytophthora fragariae TaxID=53985 RepID=A0A6A3WQD5_9STRA|nr:hypothetical protein PF002_g25102 [Phytophthora fragariae]